jgi:hypothetical protein
VSGYVHSPTPDDGQHCRNEYLVRVHIYALAGIPTHARDLAGDRHAAFSIVLAGNQTAESDRAADRLMTREAATHIRGSPQTW